MYRILTASEMQNVDRMTTNETGVPGIVLMEQAAANCFDEIQKIFIENCDLSKKKIIIVCGPGNNGGDGLAIARYFYFSAIKFNLYLAKNPGDLKNDSRRNYEILKNLGIQIDIITENNINEIDFSNAVIIDALLGAGITGIIRGIYSEIIRKINNSGSYIISIDIPSGLTDDFENVCVKADTTLIIGAFKTFFFSSAGIENAGKLKLISIHFPKNNIESQSKNIFINSVSREKILDFIPSVSAHKGINGKVCIIAGSQKYGGAAALCAAAAVECGAGLVFVLTVESNKQAVIISVPESIVSGMEEDKDGRITYSKNNLEKISAVISKCDSVIIGPGLDTGGKLKDVIEFICDSSKNKIVIIDADGLNNISDNLINIIRKNTLTQFILTPHPGEFSRITGNAVSVIQKNRNAAVSVFFSNNSGYFSADINKKQTAAENIILLKGKFTIIADCYKQYINCTGNGLLACGGSGDTLAGIIGALSAKAKLKNNSTDNIFETAAISVFLHGAAADFALEKTKNISLKPSSICNEINNVVSFLLKKNSEFYYYFPA